MTVPAATLRKVRAGKTSRLIARVAIFFITIVLIIPVGVVALGSGAGLIALPYEMFELASRAPIIFPAHMVSAALALLLAPVVVLARRRPEFHRPLGRLLGFFVVIGGLTALPVAAMSDSTPWARAGFFVQGLVWLYLLASAYVAIRVRDIRRHAHLMVAMIAVATGAVWFRLITGTATALHLPFEPIYAASAWIGWMAPLAFVLVKPRVITELMSR
ncbi:hypothetical protein HYPDE_30353 [Hyphomicrobium denitrificans 1NES1]|uniref:DUF2306 domain-containing protein n=2 Tax=Hyphomicrobium denitrificans TaxID=53399 RepID=N0BC87_9HYPH|nr:hypothetical protein HYPDE_30353 [Hyphomicrobium denitrificans 1NES1]